MSASAQNYLVDKLSSARDAQESARTCGTNAKLNRAWIRWLKFLTRIELQHDEFIDNFAQEDRVCLLGAFAQAIREREFSRSSEKDLASDTCQEAVDKVAGVFRENRRPDPHHDQYRNIKDNLLLKYNRYCNINPPTKQQKSVTPSFYRHNYNRSTTQIQKALRNLSIAAFFWAW